MMGIMLSTVLLGQDENEMRPVEREEEEEEDGEEEEEGIIDRGEQQEEVRQSGRVVRRPAWLNDYET